MKVIKMSGDARVALPLFQQECGGSIPTSPLQFEICKITLDRAKQLNMAWHSRLPRIGGPAKISFGALYDGFYYAIAIWGNPLARLLPQKEWLELKRMAIHKDAPKNTASRMIKVMTLLIKKGFPEVTTLISYQDTEVHLGTIYKASGWKIGRYTEGGDWNRIQKTTWTRPHCGHNCQSTVPKIRWEKDIK